MPKMSLAQQLLVRTLIARFWLKPYASKCWCAGAPELHRPFMLPYYVEQDMRDVVEDMRAAGYQFDYSWFAPHFNFRFPVHGKVAAHGVEMEIRHALEPWHVLGEELAAAAPVRLCRQFGRAPAESASRAWSASATPWPATAGNCRCAQPAWRASMWRACGSGPGSPPLGPAPDRPRARAVGIRYRRAPGRTRSIGRLHLSAREPPGRPQLHDAARSMRTRPRGGGFGAVSSRSAIRREPSNRAIPGVNADFPLTLDLRRV